MSQFSFLKAEFPEQFELAERAENYALSDPGASGIYARKTLESIVHWVFKHDRAMPMPLDNKLNDYLHVPQFRQARGGTVFDKARIVQRIGNRAAHESKSPSKQDAVAAVQSLFAVSHWFAHTYGRTTTLDETVRFRPHELARPAAAAALSLKQRQALQDQIDKETAEAATARQRVAELASTTEELEAQLATLRAQIAEQKAAAEARPFDDEVLSEAETRDYLIDLYLNEAGWALTDERDREYKVAMPDGSKNATGYIDYVLWGDDGRPLAVVEAKRTTVDARSGLQQASLYADALQAETGHRPVVFTTNGYEHYLWDDHADGYPPRRVHGFYTAAELGTLIGRRTTRQPLSDLDANKDIAGRPYQERAIRSMTEAFQAKTRKGLLVMATGSGKTRTIVALTDLLQRADWVKRVLFLADRQGLVNQAADAFKEHLPDIDPVNLLIDGNADGRVIVSTYQTMIGKIDERRSDGTHRFGVGHFDLVIIDEAHRSVYRKYRGIFEHFDSLLVGLTATPKDEIDKNTYGLFDLETGFPTDAYSLDEAIDDEYLVPPRGISVPLKFVRQGIRYDELDDDDKAELEASGWGDDPDSDDDDGAVPPDVSPGEINKWLYNEDTVDKMLEHLMTHGIKVAGGDRLGKTIVFAKNQKHANFIKERFDVHYPALDAGRFAQVITHDAHSPGKLIDEFKKPDSAPHIAISVDMLDTGIDVPEAVNLVIFKPVRSKAKFWQMIGRGTRLSPDLFGPGVDKTEFFVFDYCGNLEYFSSELAGSDGGSGASLGERLFATRVELICAMDRDRVHDTDRAELADLLRDTVTSMHRDNFLVRKHLRLVDKYSDAAAWANTDAVAEDRTELLTALAGLPDQMEPDQEVSKRFDLMIMNIELAVINHEPWEPLRHRVVSICGLLEGLDNVPAVAAEMALIEAAQTDDWWANVTHQMLEDLRKRLRAIVGLIRKDERAIVYTDLDDEMGEITEIDFVPTSSFAEFKRRAEAWLSEHLGDEAVAKVRSGEPLTVEDEAALQRLLVAGGVGDDETFAEASERAGSLALFVRSLIGLDRAACQAVFADFLDDKRYSSNQIRFVQMIIDELTSRGAVEARRLYEAPYMGVAPEGPEQLFGDTDADRLFATVESLHATGES